METLMEKFNAVKARTVRDMVYETLRQAIFEGRFKHGERIVEKEMAEQLQVSRTPVREAFRKLEAEGLIRYYPRKGVLVRGITAEDIIEIYAIREALETMAISFVVENVTEGEKEKLFKLIEKMKVLIEIGDDEELVRMSHLFNELLLKASRMPRLVALINNYQDYIAKFRKATLAKASRKVDALKDHEEILRAIDRMDVPRAKELTVRHLKSACRECLRAITGIGPVGADNNLPRKE
ncbi:MAG: GntR family transcriptional regulator [Firmicutes bacterium]|nr:GntR family transcriptional regulator [Bacillota bacterium]